MKEEQSFISASELAVALGLLAAFFVVFDFAAGAFLGVVYRQSTLNPEFRVEKSNPKTLVLGSSTAKYAFDPSVMDDATYNAAENGQAMFSATAFLRNMPDDLRIKRIIFGIDLPDFARGYKSPNMKYLKSLAPLAIEDDTLRAQLSLADPTIRFKYLSGLYPFNGITRQVVFKWMWPDVVGNGYKPLDQETTRIPKPRVWKWSRDVPPPESMKSFKELIKLSRKMGAELIVISTPWAGQPFLAYNPAFTVIMKKIRPIMAAGGVCDLTTVKPPGVATLASDPRMFKDRDHLNGRGAKAYSAIVRNLIDTNCGGISAPKEASMPKTENRQGLR